MPLAVARPDDELVQFFQEVFSASEGSAAGAVIGDLVHDLLELTDGEVHVFRSFRERNLIAACLFSPLRFPEDPRRVVLLSPVAVEPEEQRTGVGTAMLRDALSAVHSEGADVAVTYGDPAFYHRVGFEPITTENVQPPQALSMPHGWLGQVLKDQSAPTLRGPSKSVPRFDAPDLW
ncbi:GNAT family N-acetyltransferase [Sagittula marina]|nr:GNAT family N-acetyltransferase [Sagittula marina]